MDHFSAQPTYILLLSSLGFLSLLKSSLQFLKWLYTNFFRPSKNLRSAYGPWALVTGATDGIGKAFAFELARRGLNLVLVGRNPVKLNEVSVAIKAESGCTQIKTVVVDFAGDVVTGMGRLREVIGGVEVGVVVNCAGTTYPGAMYFDEVDERVWGDILKVNVEGTTMVIRAVVKGMLERRRGAVLNIGSGASMVVPSFPLYSVYSASKAYVDQLSRNLHIEYKNKGIDVQCQVPLYVATKMVPFAQNSMLVPTPEDYAKIALRWIGNESRCTPYWPHSIQWFLSCLLPDFILDSWRLQIGISRRRKTKYFTKQDN